MTKSISEKDGLIQITIPPDVYEMEIFNNENKSNIIDKEQYIESDYLLTIKPNFSTLGSKTEKSSKRSVITFVPDDSTRDLLGFNKTTIYEKNNLSPNPVDNLSFDKIFLDTDIAKGMIFKGQRSGKIHNFTMDVDPG